jgi:hypothetical protein
VHDQPFAIGAGAYGDGFHAALTLRGAISGRVVQMHAPEAPGAMVAMARARRIEREFVAAMAAFEIGDGRNAPRGRYRRERVRLGHGRQRFPGEMNPGGVEADAALAFSAGTPVRSGRSLPVAGGQGLQSG